MNEAVGYVLVSQVYRSVRGGCGKPGCTGRWKETCPQPERPKCHAVCLNHRNVLEPDPECLEYERLMDQWSRDHIFEEATGGTRMGPLHYFSDCHTLLHRGPRRKDSRIVALDLGTIQDLGLPTCKECAAKMAPLEREMQETEVTGK